MPGPIYLTIAAGQTVSSAFFVDRADVALTISVPSHAALGVAPQFTAVSGTAPFAPLVHPSGDGSPFTVFSGTSGAWGVIDFLPTPFARLSVNTQTTAVMTFTILPQLHR